MRGLYVAENEGSLKNEWSCYLPQVLVLIFFREEFQSSNSIKFLGNVHPLRRTVRTNHQESIKPPKMDSKTMESPQNSHTEMHCLIPKMDDFRTKLGVPLLLWGAFRRFSMETKKVPQRSGPLGSCAKDLRGRLEEFKSWISVEYVNRYIEKYPPFASQTSIKEKLWSMNISKTRVNNPSCRKMGTINYGKDGVEKLIPFRRKKSWTVEENQDTKKMVAVFHRNLQLLLFRELEPLGGNSVVLTISAKAAVEGLWHSEKWNSCHRRRRPSSGMAAFCTNQILAKTERLESLGSQDTPKTEHQQIFKHSFQRNPQEQKIPFGYGDSFRSPLWLLSCRPLFQGQLSWRYPASTSVPCARWTGESRVFYLGRNSHFVEMVKKVICWNQSASLLA